IQTLKSKIQTRKSKIQTYGHQEKLAYVLDSATQNLHGGQLLKVKNALDEGKALSRMNHIVLADLYGWDFISEYKQDPMAEDGGDEKRIRKVLKYVHSAREKKKADKAKKA
ncbi:uncharacterized protein LOC125570194, partial [Nematostella vectensis]|uniref:uncharacterized protein LOC125570194 n=1 Tax=Nematostella vectensis TaxID=45351 RepID=UPI00207743C9